MTIRYIANIRIPTEKAHGIQITSMCSAFAAAGASIELLVPYRADIPEADIFSYYGLPPSFSLRRIRTLPLLEAVPYLPSFFKRFLYTAHRFDFARCAKQDARRHPADVYYHRDEFSFRTFASAGLPSVWEMHVVPRRLGWYQEALKKALLIVTITQAIRNELIATGIAESKIICAPDGASIGQFGSLPKAAEAKENLDLPQDQVLVVYTGQLFAWKGVDTLATASKSFPPNISGIIVGGMGTELEALKTRIANESLPLRAIGQVPHAVVPSYMAAADIVVVPNSGSAKISSQYTSPLKLFEAMAAGKAIVASDLPSLREILDDECAVLVPPDAPGALANAIQELAQDPARRTHLGEAARARAEEYDWSRRAESILSAIQLQNGGADAKISRTSR